MTSFEVRVVENNLGKQIGVVVKFRANKIGYAICHPWVDKWDLLIGIGYAIRRAEKQDERISGDVNKRMNWKSKLEQKILRHSIMAKLYKGEKTHRGRIQLDAAHRTILVLDELIKVMNSCQNSNLVGVTVENPKESTEAG